MSDLIHTLLLGCRSEKLALSERLMPSSEWPGDRVGLSRIRVRRC